MRLVLDTNIIVAALRSPTGGSAALLRRIRAGKIRMLLSVPLLLEYEAVALRPEHLQAAQIAPADVTNVLALFAEPVAIHYLWRPRLRDPADEMVLEAAVNGRADAIITFNRADFGVVPKAFGIDVVDPGDILRRG
ncbi:MULTISPECIES: putative toxin-antitoxin system toxin component, PIN family [unclassified Methylobacterium]|jgi:putative PIN family toxin of toxin-antitoxin system|uniref:putative toxin-antitoxin system toxin component, PIN family n=1 Tax=unclassified Methylobacterium TaxID=2615210 RepID=UPI001355D027|nr:putative toxin-antitoxin system toxin component, PIN family [Methylobacterium sp. 2A]MWV21220.1 putative toxin-antitoxin system toxin component, PIN family [Methylobacterium sp. 2A]